MAPDYVVSSDYEDDAASSPDPLAASFDENRRRAPPTPAATRATKQQPLTASSPSKQNRSANLADVALASPAKQMLLSTPRTGGQSPWRIRVTVQAEPGSDSENVESPTVHHVTHTKTTKVPLKDADASSPVKRRGRPRKSEPAAKPNGTPVRKRATSKARRASVASASAADVDTDGTPKRKRGRPRKMMPPADDDIWGQGADATAQPGAADVETDATPKKRRGRPRKSIQPPPEDEPAPAAEPPLPTSQQQRTRLESSPTPADVSQKLRARKSTPVAKDRDFIQISSDGESEEESHVSRQLSPSQEHRRHHAEGAASDLEGFEPVQAPTTEAEGADNEEPNETHFAFDEGATRMPDDTTIIDSENFSMISVDSLPSCGSVTRLANRSTANTPNAQSQTLVQNHAYLHVPSASQEPSAPPSRYKTPSVEPVELSNPPPVEPARPSPIEAQTPRIGRVVTAGVALQGVLDPNRNTPTSDPSKSVGERRDHLDDLFRGFSERTRRELHDGLRLGEQLAQQSETSQASSPALSSPIKTMNPNMSTQGYAAPSVVVQQSRLLTPEDQDSDNAPAIQPTEVQYPTLPHREQRSGLLSPVSNSEEEEEEMSWRVDTPPVQSVNQADTQLPDLHPSRESAHREPLDIWEEQASRSSIGPHDGNAYTDTPQIQGLPARDSPINPARGKVPRARRRLTTEEVQYSDEAEEGQAPTPPSTESEDSVGQRAGKGKGKMLHTSIPEDYEDNQNDGSEGSDDTGMFFQANMPSLFNKKQSGQHRRRRTEKLDISLNLDQSLLPESSPPPAARTPAMDKTNPFLNTPPQLIALRSSPVKSSPLRQELRGSDISSDSPQQMFDESTLPLAPSSPFHTFVEGDTGRSIASDQRQLLREMAGTDSSLCRIRNEANEYLDAYDPQERTLHDLTEVTEPSRTWNKDPTVLASSPPKLAFAESVLRSNSTHLSRFVEKPPSSSLSEPLTQAQHAPDPVSSNAPNNANAPNTASAENKELAQQHPNVSNSTALTFSPTMRRVKSPPPAHPALSKLDPLPRVEPWTKTHYKTLDKLYQLYKKQPTIFSIGEAPNAALNTTLLTNFLNATTYNFVGARYRAWGYNVIFTDALIVLCAAYMQLLTLNSVDEYEEKVGKSIQIGDCMPGAVGIVISAENVVERLATVVLGEAVRRDEKRGKAVDKSGRLRVEWPQ